MYILATKLKAGDVIRTHSDKIEMICFLEKNLLKNTLHFQTIENKNFRIWALDLHVLVISL